VTLEITILGCGSSGGVPRADGTWGACDPNDPRNLRTRCSMLARRLNPGGDREQQTTVVVDTSPDFRLQAVAADVRRLDAVLLTHDHADQTHGLDDIRAFAIRMRQRMNCYMDQATHHTLMRRFGYIFRGEAGYPAICNDHPIPEHGLPWSITGPSGDIPVITFDQDHGGPHSVGYRIGPVAYSSDVVELDEAAFAALAGVKVWIVDALRYAPHPTHAHLERTLAWIDRVRPERAILTNMHIDLDFERLKRELPPGGEPGYDGLRFEIEI
jgi:phosphoribosyl 1,2-cyclic phosphate phosphodiesterase